MTDLVTKVISSAIITATTFQLNLENPKDGFKFKVGSRVISPLGAGVITSLCTETGNCKILLDKPI